MEDHFILTREALVRSPRIENQLPFSPLKQEAGSPLHHLAPQSHNCTSKC